MAGSLSLFKSRFTHFLHLVDTTGLRCTRFVHCFLPRNYELWAQGQTLIKIQEIEVRDKICSNLNHSLIE